MCCKNLQLMWNLPQVGSQWSRPPFAAALVFKHGLFESDRFSFICFIDLLTRVVWSVDAFENYLGHLRRPNPTRGDRVHSDPVFREVQRHVLCQNVDRALGRSIGPPRKVCTCSFFFCSTCLFGWVWWADMLLRFTTLQFSFKEWPCICSTAACTMKLEPATFTWRNITKCSNVQMSPSLSTLSWMKVKTFSQSLVRHLHCLIPILLFSSKTFRSKVCNTVDKVVETFNYCLLLSFLDFKWRWVPPRSEATWETTLKQSALTETSNL